MQQHGDTPEQRQRRQQQEQLERERDRDRDRERERERGLEQRPLEHGIHPQYASQYGQGQPSNILPKPMSRSLTSPPAPVSHGHISSYAEPPFRPEGQVGYRPAESPYRHEHFRPAGPYRPPYTSSYSYSPEYTPRPIYCSHPPAPLASPGPAPGPAPGPGPGPGPALVPVPAPPGTYYRSDSREYSEYYEPSAPPPTTHWQYQQPMPPPYPPYPDRSMYEQMYSTYSNIASSLPGAIHQVNLPHIDSMISQAAAVAQTFDARNARAEPRRKRKASSSSASSSLYCHSCMTTETPEWRKGPMGPRTLCNACGLIWAKLEKAKRKKEEEDAQARDGSRPTGEVGTISAPSTQGGPSVSVAPVPTPSGPPHQASSIPPTPGSTASASTVGSNSTALTSPELSKPLTVEASTKGKQPEDFPQRPI